MRILVEADWVCGFGRFRLQRLFLRSPSVLSLFPLLSPLQRVSLRPPSPLSFSLSPLLSLPPPPHAKAIPQVPLPPTSCQVLAAVEVYLMRFLEVLALADELVALLAKEARILKSACRLLWKKFQKELKKL